MKTTFIGLGMTVILFFYGYIFSMVGLDHNSHEKMVRSGEQVGSEHGENSH